ncbi:hypothetical protein [Lacipirellula limnantheis]|uniref:Restriction endonuclease type IV Mrr domain-containing protein n=1 Tax=Lacipirellula limnantheis TaxID=2528024 RepID=A0A517TSS2_9BACT|nr:hypothetical protein [Lacipirellula limnantheis]QDT71402.1 hypothetical protein I41_05590 [Lacipirellula limnantheis]
MPKRTNDFQKLVRLIQQAFAPKGATVTESAMEPVPGFKNPREIDILVQTQVGPYRIRIAVEATDSGRKLDHATLGKIYSKYFGDGSVKVNKVVIVTREGFTEDAVARAKLNDIERLTLKEALKKNWSADGAFINFEMAPHVCKVLVEPAFNVFSTKGFIDEATLTCTHGKKFGTLRKYANFVFWQQIVPRDPAILQKIQLKALNEPNGQASATIAFELDHHSILYLGKQYKANRIKIIVHAIVARGSLNCVEYEVVSESGNVQTVRVAEGIAGPKKFTLVIPESTSDPKVVLDVADAIPATSKEKKSAKKKTTKKKVVKKRAPKKEP